MESRFSKITLAAAVLAIAACRGGGGVRSDGGVDIAPIAERLYVGSYLRVPVRLSNGARFDDFEFTVAGAPLGGMVSASKDASFNEKQPHLVLIAGSRPGRYSLVATNRATGVVVEKEEFAVTAHAPVGNRGPSLAVQARDRLRTGSAWGGGTAGPQNVNSHQALGTRPLAVIFVDTSDQRFSAVPGAFSTLRDHWRDALINGTNVGGVNFSLRRYYQEASRGLFDVAADFYGPFAMPGTWDVDGGGAGFAAHIQAAITAADSAVNYLNYRTVLVVSQSVIGTGGAADRFAWPIATIGEWGGWVTDEGTLGLGAIQMPHDWDVRDGREIWETASHELGHNLGMGDQYTPTVAGRNLGGWDLMHADGLLPELSLAHKLRLGWVDAAWVIPFDFATLGAPVDQSVTLSPVAAGAPPAGRFVGAEVRLTDGWNYYFEYRTDESTRVADRQLPTNDRVLGTDVVAGPFVPPILRPGLLLLPKDSDGDGPVLGNGQDYRATDSTDPVYPVEFNASVSGIDGTKADLRFRYGVNGKPDPSIRPWGAPPWQTADIEVRNARNAADPAWFNVPWQGNPNDVVAKVKNNGTLDAPGVVVNFFVKDYNVGGAPETFIGQDTRNIGPGATVEFHANWVPPSAGHYCVVVRIPLYVRAGTPAVAEMTELNNLAQSNYDRFISATASPAERRVTTIKVGNPYPRATRVYLDVQQTNPVYRTYLGHRWVDLESNETIEVEVMVEYVGEPPAGSRLGDQIPRFQKLPNDASITAFIVDPADESGHHIVLLGGAGLSVATGRATRIEEFAVVDGTIRGHVVTADGKSVDSGKVILTLRGGEAARERITNVTIPVSAGSFSSPVRQRGGDVRAYFVPSPGLGDAESPTIRLRD